MNKEIYLEEYPKHKNMRENVKRDKNRLHFHMMPPTGWMNDPNGLCQFHGINHIYFQYTPFLAGWGTKLWGHYTTKDWIHYEEEEPFLFPDTKWDRDGVYSGSAIVKEDGIHFFYTGNVKLYDKEYDYIMNGREQNTMHLFSPDGKNIIYKEMVMTNDDYPSNMSKHVRDPKVYEKDGTYYMIQGGRDEKDRGCALLFQSADLKNWKWYDTIYPEKTFGYMWECPDLFEIDGQQIMTCCPQGVETRGIDYENVHQVTAMKLDYDFDTDEYEITDIKLFDRGFDFYAPQSFEDESGRRILIGWMGIPDADYTNPTEEAGWQHALTIPRELSVRDGKLIQEPIEELKQLRSEDKAVCTFCYGQTIIMQNNIYEAIVDFKRCREMVMTLREGITLSYKDYILTLNLGVYGSGRSTRKVRLEKLEHLQIFADTSSLEIFVNHGEEVFTTRIYNLHGRILINGECSGIMTVYPLKSFEIEGGRHEE